MDKDNSNNFEKFVTVEKNDNRVATPVSSPKKVSSDTNVDIGLDLLVNKEKKRPKKMVVNEQVEGFDLNKIETQSISSNRSRNSRRSRTSKRSQKQEINISYEIPNDKTSVSIFYIHTYMYTTY